METVRITCQAFEIAKLYDTEYKIHVVKNDISLNRMENPEFYFPIDEEWVLTDSNEEFMIFKSTSTTRGGIECPVTGGHTLKVIKGNHVTLHPSFIEIYDLI